MPSMSRTVDWAARCVPPPTVPTSMHGIVTDMWRSSPLLTLKGVSGRGGGWSWENLWKKKKKSQNQHTRVDNNKTKPGQSLRKIGKFMKQKKTQNQLWWNNRTDKAGQSLLQHRIPSLREKGIVWDTINGNCYWNTHPLCCRRQWDHFTVSRASLRSQKKRQFSDKFSKTINIVTVFFGP